jgi:hypothetical protein
VRAAGSKIPPRQRHFQACSNRKVIITNLILFYCITMKYSRIALLTVLAASLYAPVATAGDEVPLAELELAGRVTAAKETGGSGDGTSERITADQGLRHRRHRRRLEEVY